MDFLAGMGYGDGMARIKWNTEYNRLDVAVEKGESGIYSYSGTFVMVKLRGMLFFQATDGSVLHPVANVTRAVIA